ncbi:MAG: tRNA uridine-5-carboxymethylaminomethyl(34) synthesis GTPase MnmE [Bacteroidetes bacterium]|nr:tRNA uridine-5-carboxymethylaminomethyl(34) synthesis GTPase MnmE [Bacteroidota bacterium]
MELVQNDTIAAIATPPGMGAIAIVRISGSNTFSIIEKVFHSKKGNALSRAELKPRTLLYGTIVEDTDLIDDVMLSIYKSPQSYTGEDAAEIACHGSPYIQSKILLLLIKHGCRIADPGEFTLRAFVNGKMDLTQAEAVADVIHAEDAASHKLAMHQLRGGIAEKLATLRQSLIEFTALVELELDFAEEDVAFADRTQLLKLVNAVNDELHALLQTFKYGNAIKNGIAVAIAGAPNAGKSTLLNALLREDRAIVSDIPGTTRDTIEEAFILEGIKFRLIDTAGIRHTEDVIEKQGVERSLAQIQKADVVIYVLDATTFDTNHVNATLKNIPVDKELIIALNKTDLKPDIDYKTGRGVLVKISASNKIGIDLLQRNLVAIAQGSETGLQSDTIITNQRHYQALLQAQHHINEVIEKLNTNMSADYLSLDLRAAIRHIGNITGYIDVDRDILGTIFSKFCIGK